MTSKMIETKRRNNSFRNGLSGRVKRFVYNGVEYLFQGYEDILIKYCLSEKIDIKTRESVPSVFYSHAVSKLYKADIYLPEYNLIIDVKSERTITMDLDKLIAKQQAVLDTGFNFIYFCISSKVVRRDRVISDYDKKCFDDYVNMLISSQDLNEVRFNDYPVVGSTLQAIGSGSAKGPIMDRDIV